ncbi:MAG: hypothetical protein AB7N71_11495 [Phycisphaerae bacterium]
MSIRTLRCFLVLTLLAQSGCTGQSTRDAVAAGVFDFVAGAITALLNALFLGATGISL